MLMINLGSCACTGMNFLENLWFLSVALPDHPFDQVLIELANFNDQTNLVPFGGIEAGQVL